MHLPCISQNKGRVACEVSTADELLVTELVFSGTLNTLPAAHIASLLSCLVAESGGAKGGAGGKTGKGGKAPDPTAGIRTKAMHEPFEKLRELARRVGTVVEEARLPIDVAAYVDKLGTDLVLISPAPPLYLPASPSYVEKLGTDLVPRPTMQSHGTPPPWPDVRAERRGPYRAARSTWLSSGAAAPSSPTSSTSATGTPIAARSHANCRPHLRPNWRPNCCRYEGSIIRTLHRLEELLRQCIDAARVVGNEELEARCAEARKLLVRDVVFAASLYT